MTRGLGVALGGVFLLSGGIKVWGWRPDSDGGARRAAHGKWVWAALGLAELALGAVLVTAAPRMAIVAALAFLVVASGYLAVSVVALDRQACPCFGRHRHGQASNPVSESVRAALRPAWFFVRNGTLVLVAGRALSYPASVTGGVVTLVGGMILVATLASVVRLRRDLTSRLVTG